MKKRKKLTPREKTFCSSYINSGNIKESAMFAGYKLNPQITGEKLLCREDIIKEVSRLSKLQKKSLKLMATVGYKRLAFGNIADAISLLYMEECDLEKLKNMDLFSISEIKCPRDGAMEIKFFDRLKALEKLEDSTPENSRPLPFYEALNKGAKAVSEKGIKFKDED